MFKTLTRRRFSLVAIVALVLMFVRVHPVVAQDVSATTGANGLATLSFGGHEFIANGEFRVDNVVLRRLDGTQKNGDVSSQLTWDADKRRITRTYSWGSASCLYTAKGGRLDVSVEVRNSSDSIIDGLDLHLMELKFPQAPRGWVAHYPVLTDNRGAPAVIYAAFAQSALALCNEESGRPLTFGFAGRESLTTRPLSVSTHAPNNVFYGPSSSGAVSSRPIFPGASDTYRFSLRFGTGDAPAAQLASDVFERFAKSYPSTLKWSDRRAIGALHLSTSEKEHHTQANPRGWFGGAKDVDISTPAGRALFGKRLSDYAEQSIRVLKANRAQGMIVWDIEGQQYPHATSYLGDPRSLPAEMEPLADSFFARFKAAGLRTGITIRPQVPVRAAYGEDVSQIEVPDAAHLLIEKIAYARKRWGCTLFYIDSNVHFDVRRAGNDGNAYRMMDASIFAEVAAAHPDVLLVPEHENTRYYAYSAPYHELRQGYAGTPESVRTVYPGALSVVYVPDGPVEAMRAELVASVKRGDILMFRGWWDDAFNAQVKSIYEDAAK